MLNDNNPSAERMRQLVAEKQAAQDAANEARRQQQPFWLMNEADLCALFGCGRTSIWRWVGRGRIPRPVRIGSHTSRWRSDEIFATIERATTARDVEQQGAS